MIEYEQDGMIIVDDAKDLTEADWVSALLAMPHQDLPYIGWYASGKHNYSLAKRLLTKSDRAWADYLASVVKEQS